jgi:hypothetical protein
MQSLYLLLFFLSFFQTVPFKPKEEFEVKLNYEFRPRPTENASKIKFEDTRTDREKHSASSVLPYLKLNINVLTAAGAVKAKFESNKSGNLPSKKVKDGVVLPLDIGYTDDVKDRVAPHQYTITFLAEDKKPISKIVIFIDKDGTFFVNDEKRGKF